MSASAAANKALILDYFAVVGGRSDKSIGDFFAADVVWQMPQSNPMTPNPRRGFAAVMELMGAGIGVYKAGTIQIDLQHLIADDEQVAAQFTLSAQLANGNGYDNNYSNHYCFVFSIANGKIAAVWEYLDSLYQWRQGALGAAE